MAEVLRVIAVLLGTLPPALFAAVGIAKLAIVPAAWSVALAIVLAIPLWIAAICGASLIRSAARTWAACAIASLVFGLAAYAT